MKEKERYMIKVLCASVTLYSADRENLPMLPTMDEKTIYIDGLGFPRKDVDSIIKDIHTQTNGLFSDKKEDYWFHDGRLISTVTSTEKFKRPNNEEYDAWDEGRLTLYTAKLVVDLNMTPVGSHTMTAEEAEKYGLKVK